MKFFQFLLFSSIPFAAIAAKKASADKFTEYHARSLSSTPLKLDSELYEYLTAAPRNYTLAVELTALDAKFGCQLCKEFQPEWELLAKSWTKGDKKGESHVLFGTLDFIDGRSIFQKLMLQTAPIILLFPPTVGPHAPTDTQPIRNDFSQGPQSAEQIHGWLARHISSDPKPPLVRPINWLRIIMTSISILGAISFVSVAYPYFLPIIQNRKIWAAASLVMILLFTTGHMFNHIRKVPYIAGDGKGGVAYFAGGFSNEFGIESQIIAMIYGVLSFTIIFLSTKVPTIADAKKQQLFVIIFSTVVFAVYSFLISIFRVKNGGYPFRLPPF
ncbi:MAG: oligosaccharyl transferase subunit ost3/OST6 [Cirrosporium novae-zelandiae]|nr:MAG: oligosaccharyl transferase subunit ost3/OST6 [Cirrosporium novae-zelandiae]